MKPSLLPTAPRQWLLLAGTAALTVAVVHAEPPEGQGNDVPRTQRPPRFVGGSGDSDLGPGDRVILRLGRHREVMGHVELDDADVIVVRTLSGSIESHPRLRILDIVRLVDPEPDQRGTVVLRNGQQRTGIIIEDAFEHVLIEVEGIRARLMREAVDRILLEPSFEDRYAELRATVRPGMIDQHLVLCRWLVDHRRYELARENLLEILEHKEFGEARQMLRVVDAQLALLEQSAERERTGAPRRGARDDAPRPEHPLAGRILSRDELNVIRVYEIDFDNPPRVSISQEAIRMLVESRSTSDLIPASQAERARLFRADPLDVTRLMFELRARELYPEIKVHSEPMALNAFRQRLHDTWLLHNCATSGCHGGPDAGALFLHRNSFRDERVRYTNFLILDRLVVDPQWPLINYDDPEMSLIIQYALPRHAARLPHPDVPGWKPVFARANERMKRDSIEWIRSMMQPRPEYPVDFDPTRMVREAMARDRGQARHAHDPSETDETERPSDE
jgi:hypothetical protein